MKILVGYKRVLDYSITARPNAAGTAVELAGQKMSSNPFDDIALEEALRLKEKGAATEVIAVSIGAAEAAETLRTALAMGADRAVHLKTDIAPEPEIIAQAFADLARELGAGFCLMGKQAIDSDSGQTPSMTAQKLGWSQALNALKVEISGTVATVVSEVDGGLQTQVFDLPGVVSVDLRLNTPRFVTMPNIIKARSKPIETRPLAVPAPRVQVTGVFTPSQARKNVMVESLDDLLKHLEGTR